LSQKKLWSTRSGWFCPRDRFPISMISEGTPYSL
jgi:hypothetical protein